MSNVVSPLMAALCGALLLLVPAARPLVAQEYATIVGVVRDSATQAPVEHAVVRVAGSSSAELTDRDGRFRLQRVAMGTVRVVVQRAGYRADERDVTVAAGTRDLLIIVLSPSVAVIDAMSVVASRTTLEATRDLPVSIGTVSGTELAQMRPVHVAQPLNRIAGVHLTQFEGGGSYPSVRSNRCCKPTLLFMEDGIPFTSPAYYSPNYIGMVNFAQAAQVDVLKGPGTAAYGSDAVTGVINFVTAAAPLTPEARVHVEGGAAGYRRLLGVAGGSFGNHNIATTLNVAAADGRRGNPYSSVGATARWQTWFANGHTLRTLISVNTRDGTGADDQTPEQFAARSRFNPYRIAFDNWRTVRASMSYRKEGGTTSYSVTPFLRYEDSDRVPGWQLSYDPVVWSVTSRSYGLLAQVRRELGGRLGTRLTAGADVDVTPGRRREPILTAVEDDGVWVSYSLDAAEPHYDYRFGYAGAAGYAQVDLSPIEPLRLSIGARYDAARYNYANMLPVVQTGSYRRPADTTLSYSGLAPKFGAVYAIGEHSRLFASHRRGFRIPIENQLFRQGGSQNTLDLKPVRVESNEFGFRSRIGGALGYEVAAYDMQLADDILSVRDPAGVSTFTNNGRSRHRGVELSANISVTRSVRVDLALSQAVHRFVEWSPSTTLTFSGNEIEASPRSTRNAVLTWQPRPLSGGQLQLEYAGNSGYWVNSGNTIRQDGHDVVHLRASWPIMQRLDLHARMMNVFDVLYAAQTFPGFGAVDRVMNPGEPRAVYLGAQMRF